MSGKPTPGPIGRKGSFLWQLDDGGLYGRPVNLWSGLLSPNNCYPSKYAEDAARLFVAAPALYDAADMALNALIGCCVPAGGVDDRKTMLEAQSMLRAALAAAVEQSNG